ncbi:MAG: hypothetical protein B7C54_08565 [Acidimicrobiales bacterium mtb01]|nr:methyltransferase [Actinomycetota bacterium]TEX45161.1 MAG: hypothetical protein B7C54_08565 [Acidimicrobiales bacterium mtb01]
MAWGIAVDTTLAEVEFVSDLLWGLGVVAVTEHWQNDGTVTLRTSLGDDVEDVRRTLATLPPGVAWRMEEIDDADGTQWRRHAEATVVSERMIVVPSWLDAPATDHEIVVRIETGATFGLGNHPTTLASLRMVERLVRPGQAVLDVGCGSGVLGIAALKLGASSALGVDVSVAVLTTSVENAETNGVADRWSVTTDALATIQHAYPLVLANILAPTLIELSADLKRVLKKDGALVISGVLDGHYGHVADALRPLVEVERIVIDGWVAAAFR